MVHTGDPQFDLIVVGAGLSGLAAAYYWCSRVDASASVLVLEASARIGGSSVRHTFDVEGRALIAPGGAQELVFPSSFAPNVTDTLAAIGVDIEHLASRVDPSHYAKRGAPGHAFCFAERQWGSAGIAIWHPGQELCLDDTPLCDEAKRQLAQIFRRELSWLDRLDEAAKLEALRTRSCAEVLSDFGEVHEEVARFFAYSSSPSSGMPFSSHPALDAALVGYPPLGALAPRAPGPWLGLTRAGRQFFGHASPKVYRYPDGNATVARAFLAWLRPDIFSSGDAETRVDEPLDMDKLRDPKAARQVRCQETVRVIRPAGPEGVIVDTTGADGRPARYRGTAAILATWASAAPSVVPTLSDAQKATAARMGRFPVVTATIALTNWRPWRELGVSSLSWPGHPHWQRAELGFAVTFGSHAPADSPDDPNTITAIGSTTSLHRQPSIAGAEGRAWLEAPNRAASLADELVRLLRSALEPAGFDARKDVRGVVVEPWPHGYSRYSTSLDDRDLTATPDEKRALGLGVGPIAIAGADVADHPFLDGALEAAFNAVIALEERGHA